MNKYLSQRNIGGIKKIYEKSLIMPKEKSKPQFFVCPIGLIGAGKTTILKPLSQRLSLLRITTDDIRKILKKRGYDFKAATEIAFDTIRKYAKQGYSIAIDADCARSAKRKRIKKLAEEVGAKIIWIHINPSEEYIVNKLKNFKHTWLFKDADDAIKNYFVRKPLHKNIKIKFLYTFDPSQPNVKKQISEAVFLIRAELKK